MLNICCDNFLEKLHPIESPPVECPSCQKKITYERVKIQSAMSSDANQAPQFIDDGYSLVNPKYID